MKELLYLAVPVQMGSEIYKAQHSRIRLYCSLYFQDFYSLCFY
jgi:hypothetical protein